MQHLIDVLQTYLSILMSKHSKGNISENSRRIQMYVVFIGVKHNSISIYLFNYIIGREYSAVSIQNI